MSLARVSDDPAHKHRYEDLALEFVQRAAGRSTSPSNLSHFADFNNFEIVPGTRQFDSRCNRKAVFRHAEGAARV
jgi:hypothetical protein